MDIASCAGLRRVLNRRGFLQVGPAGLLPGNRPLYWLRGGALGWQVPRGRLTHGTTLTPGSSLTNRGRTWSGCHLRPR